MKPSRRILTDAVRAALLAFFYIIAAKLALKLASVQANATPVWPPTGIALAALLLGGLRLWPGVAVGAFVANLLTAGSVASSVGIAAGNTLEALLGAWLVIRFAGGRDAFEHPGHIVAFVLLASLGSTTVSATVGVASLSTFGHAPWSRFGEIWTTWWLGNACGTLLVAPVLVQWGKRPKAGWTAHQAFEAGALVASLLGVVVLVFGGVLRDSLRISPVAFLSIPILLWAAFRFGPRETATAMLVLATGAVWGTLEGRGPFTGAGRNESLLLLQIFMGVISVMVLVLASAVRERERVRSELHESEARMHLILDTALDGVITMNSVGTISDWNPQAERIFGWTRAEAIGRKLSETIVPPALRVDHERGLTRFMESGHGPYLNQRIELTALHRDGREVPVELSIAPMKKGGEVFFAGFVRDITARKQAEELFRNHLAEIERLNGMLRHQKAEISTYYSLVTHDVSNFCATLQAVLERLFLEREGPLTPKQRELLLRANRQGFEMNRLAENAKLLSRLRDKGLPPPGDRVSVRGTIEHAVDIVRSVQFDRPFQVDLECPEGLVMAGIPFVKNLFLNIIDNAVRYTPRGQEPVIQIRCDVENEAVRVRIRGGETVDDALLSRVFDRYSQGPHSTGTGLGLAVLREIVERSGGRVEARNAKDVGAGVFEIALSLPKG